MIISVAVITYNSSKTVIDTLNSILEQSYKPKNIELIISDDASTDDTVDIIEDWIKCHKESFYKIIFVRNPVNLGVSRNINTAWKKSTAEWVKTIAGDDLLVDKCIELNVEYIKKNTNCRILFSKMKMFGRSDAITPNPYDIKFFDINSQKQHEWLRTFSFNIAPSSFISTELLKKVGYADERYRMIEDLPLWLKITKAGYKLYFLDAITVYYRVGESISLSSRNYINRELTRDLILIYKDNKSKFSKSPFIEWLIIERILNYKLMLLVSKLANNKLGRVSTLGSYAMKLFRPGHAIKKIANKVNRAVK